MYLGELKPIVNVEAYSAFMAVGVTCEQAGAGLSALACPTYHAHTVPVELAATGEKVAALCLDCDQQLPADWKTTAT